MPDPLATNHRLVGWLPLRGSPARWVRFCTGRSAAALTPSRRRQSSTGSIGLHSSATKEGGKLVWW